MIKTLMSFIIGALFFSGCMFLGFIVRFAFLQGMMWAPPVDSPRAVGIKVLYLLGGAFSWGGAYVFKKKLEKM